MASLMLDLSAPSRPYASLQATIRVAIILQNFRKCLKARLRRKRGAEKPLATRHGGTWRSRVTSQWPDGFETRRSSGVRLTWPRFSSSESRDQWFTSLLNELDKYTRVGKLPLWKTAADDKILLHDDSPLEARNVGLRDVAYYFSIITAVLGRLTHHRPDTSAQAPFTLGKGNEVDDSDDLDDEKFGANLEHLLRCLEQSLYDLLVQKTVELLYLEALYWRQHLDDGLFAEKPSKRQQLSSTWPWAIPTALLVLWGVCWMFYDSFQRPSKPLRSVLRDDYIRECWPPDKADLYSAGAQDVSGNLTPNPEESVVVPPASLLSQAPNPGGCNIHLSEPLIINTAPQPIRQQGYEKENEIGEPPLSIFNSRGGQRRPGDRNSFPFGLYNHGHLPQHSFDSLASALGTAAASSWHDSSGSAVSDLSTDVWYPQYNEPYQPSPPLREGAPLLTLQGPDAESPTFDIYPPQFLLDVLQCNFENLQEEDYEASMPDPDNYPPSPASEGSGGPLQSKYTSSDRAPVIVSINNPEQTSSSSVGSAVRPRLSLKRDHDPPRNEVGKITCLHQECSRKQRPIFQRKCEWSKHMDKHDRPYICTESGCEKIRGFTYSGGLLRHQREVHKKHGGPKAPLMCPHNDCKRSTGKGFTRRENLVEHLRRVHRKDAPDHGGVHKHRTSTDPHDEDDEIESPPAASRKRKRSLVENETQPDLHAASIISDEAGGDLREEVKRLKRQNDEKDLRLRDLESFVATIKQQMHR